MHAIKGGWSGQISALASENGSGGRKARIRRSKEERKAMVESFIKKYQKSNDGNFPSLTLTHKEVGGSFYTVREIVREIIQENRVLASPKLLEDDSGFLEHFPLGCISMEPQMGLLGSDRIHMSTHSAFNEYQIANEDISNSSLEFIESSTLELNKEQVNRISKMVEGEGVSEGASSGHRASNHYQDMNMEDVSNCLDPSTQLKSHKFENEKIVSSVEVLEEKPQYDKPLGINDVGDSGLLSSEKISSPGIQMPVEVQSQDKHVEITNKTREFSEGNSEESASLEILDKEKNGAQHVEASQPAASRMNSDVEVEKFPLRSFAKTIYDEDGGSKELHWSAKMMDNKAIQSDPVTLIQDPPDHVNEKDAKGLLGSTKELSLQDPRMKHSNDFAVVSMLNVDDVTIPEHQKSLPNGIEVNASTKHSIPESSISIRRKIHNQGNISLSEGSNPNCETSTKSSRPETNPLVVLLKAIASSFIKFWTE